jgi:hypothetical protein
VQEYLANRTYPTSSDSVMPKMKGRKKKYELVQLPYQFKFEKLFKEPCQEWLEMIEIMFNEILGNYTKKRRPINDNNLQHPTKTKVKPGNGRSKI